jgi:UDP-N-acetylglucosamine/UDP-N-acetylgalactosamine diphosphorylase
MDEIVQACPSLRQVLDQEPSLKTVVEDLLSLSLGGVFSKYLADANARTVRTFLNDASRLDFSRIELHQKARQRGEQQALSIADVAPVPLVTLEEQQSRRTDDTSAGRDSLADGRWASVAFAGGAGTRFFSRLEELEDALPQPNQVLLNKKFDPSEPKGNFPISPVGGLSFYENIIAEALEAGVQSGRAPWVLFMTSPVTHDHTVRFLETSGLWGFPQEYIVPFMQAQEPRLDEDGDLIVMDDSGHLVFTGDGHGGVYRALLANENLLERITKSGVAHLVMHNVDNPAARPFAPTRLGFHLREGAQFTLSGVRKTDPAEKVGLLMKLKASGKVEVVEYNVLSEEVARARDEKTGRLQHEAGNANTNLIAADAVRADIEPTLYAGKSVSSRRGPVSSSSLEMLNQHITRLLDPQKVRAYEVERREFFMPTKNVTGVDSAESTNRMLSDRFARMLEQAGAEVHPDSLCDLHPACTGLGPGLKLEAGSRLYMGARQSDAQGAPVTDGPLILEPGSSLVVYAARPYGDIRADTSRQIKIDAAKASRLKIGSGVTIKSGVRVVLHIGPGTRLTIPAGRVISQNIQGEVGPGEDQEL